MTRRERLRRAYFHRPMDRPAVYNRTNYPPDDPSYDRLKAYLAQHAELKRIWPAMREAEPWPTETRTEPISQDWQRRVKVLHTPDGDLTSSRRVSLTGQPGLDEIWFVETRQDAEKVLSVPDPVLSDDVDGFFTAEEKVGEAGIAQAALGMNPAGFVAGRLCGSENFALLSATDRDVLHALCERRTALLRDRLEFLLARGVGPYFGFAGHEFITPPLHGPRDFEDFNVRYDQQLFDLIHEAGGRVHVHCHGSVKDVMDGFRRAGADVLHPFEAPPCGDIEPAEAKRAARGAICLEGNIQIADMYQSTPEQIRRQVRGLIEDCFDDRRGLIVSPTASPYIRGAGQSCFPQYRAMVEAVRNWGG
ncbi:MAG: uroporphyrinogen decarboxylase family protein [Planctomycetota bacterium]